MFILTLTPSVRELGSRDLSNSFITFYSAVLYQAGEMSFNKEEKLEGFVRLCQRETKWEDRTK